MFFYIGTSFGFLGRYRALLPIPTESSTDSEPSRPAVPGEVVR